MLGKTHAFPILCLAGLFVTRLNAATAFNGAKSYDAGATNSVAMVVGDLNGDGKPDLVIANHCIIQNCSSAPSSIAVLLGNADGTFQTARTFPVTMTFGTYTPVGLAVGDVNGDGKADVILAGNNELGLLLGNGDGTLQSLRTIYPISTSFVYATSVVIADVNGDGKKDLVIGESSDGIGNGDGGVSVLLGNGDGTFGMPQVYDAGGAGIGGPYGEQGLSIAVADVNGDGKLDVLVGLPRYEYGGQVGVLLGNGNGSFRAPKTYDSGGFTVNSIAVADINGDEKPDVVVSNYCTGFLEICTGGSVGALLGNGDGTFQSATVYPTGGHSPASITVGDLWRNGKIDIVVANYTSSGNRGSAAVFSGNGDGTFQPAQIYSSAGAFATSVAIADVNGDGKLDLLEINSYQSYTQRTDGTAVVRLNNYLSATTVTLSSTPDPATFGQAVTLTATVTSTGLDVPTGKVSFKRNGTGIGTVTLSGGVATLTTTKLPVGTLSMTATYEGDTFSAKSTSMSVTQTVNP